MLFKLAFRNVKRQIGNYLVYFITVSFTVALLFSVNNLLFSDIMEEMKELYADFVQPILLAVSCVLSVIIAVVLAHATSFLLRRRKKEFGLYLTLGMTRGNILAIFAGETAVNFLFALGAGMLIGVGVYQALMAVFVNFLEMEYAVGSYSAAGVFVTVAMVLVMFLIASAASLGYLRFAKLSLLLQGDKIVEKKVRWPALWPCLLAAAVFGLCVSLVRFEAWLQSDDFFERVGELGFLALLFCACVILIPVGFSKTLLFVALRMKRAMSRGTATFTVRQLSGRLNANAVMVGVLSLLLTIAVVGPNVFLTMNARIGKETDDWYYYDITGEEYGSPVTLEEAVERIEKYADIKAYSISTAYTVPYPEDDDTEMWNLYSHAPYIGESAFRRMCEVSGFTAPQLNGGYLSCSRTYDDRYGFDADVRSSPVRLNGEEYACAGTVTWPWSSGMDSWSVVPDEALGDGTLEKFQRYLIVMLEEPHYDARALYWELVTIYPDGNRGSAYTIKEYERLDSLGQVALFLLGDLFVSVVFILLSMAMLALKMLSTLAEDKERYRTLWRLGADESMLRKTLFSQMFFFYFLPFVLPFILCVPLVNILKSAVVGPYDIGLGAIIAQVAAFAGLMLALYALYFTVTYLIAWREIKKTVRSVG